MITSTQIIQHLNKIANYCVETNENLIFVKDEKGTALLSTTCIDIEQCLCIKNEANKSICLIPIDGKGGLLGYGKSYCDAIIFDVQSFSFLEFKLNATSLNTRAIRKNRRKAIQQLVNTIQYFDEKLAEDYLDLTLEAFVVTPQTYPRQDTSWQELSVAFLEEFGIPLYESQTKIYD